MSSSMLLITTTKGRPVAFNDYLTKWIKKQTYQEFDWLIVCDDPENYKFPKKAKVIEREPTDTDLHSMCANWQSALAWIETNGAAYNRFCVMEDDDWYSDNYLYEMNKMLDQADLAGYCEDAYYFVLSRRCHRCHNRTHASLAATGFRRPVLPFLRTIVDKGLTTIDSQLWMEWKGSKILSDNFTGLPSDKQPKLDNNGMAPEHPRHIGCKEPWHGGLHGASSYPLSGGFDNTGKVARRWFGEEDSAAYLKYTRSPKIGTPFVLLEMPME